VALTNGVGASVQVTPGMELLLTLDNAWPLSPEEREFIDAVKKLAAAKIAPSAEETDRLGLFPKDNIAALNEMGCNQVFVPEAYGGLGASNACYLRMVEELSRACPSTAISWATTYHSITPVIEFGTEAQKQRFLPAIANGAIGALAITEATGGSDVRAIRTRMQPVGDEVVIDGSKIYITNGDVADVYVVFGKWTDLPDRDSLTAIVVERDRAGVLPGRVESKLGHRGSSTTEVQLDNVRVPAENVLGNPGDGFAVLISALNYSRPSIAAHALGIARSALEDALEYINDRRQFGKRILEFQGVQFMIADLASRLAMAETMLIYVSNLVTAGGGTGGIEASMLKVMSTDLAMDAASAAVQLRGGYGYMSGCRAERLFRDAKLTQIFEGANELHRERVGRSFLVRE